MEFRAHKSGFTVLEILMVVTLIAILASLLLPVTARARAQAEGVRCMANLRALHTALGSYTSDHGHWPQHPSNLDDAATQAWWVHTLEPYGITPNTWICPTLAHDLDARNATAAERPVIHYTPTNFDARQFTPFRWSKQPWIIEVGALHGRGNLMIFPDGSIRPFNDVYKELTGRDFKAR